MRTERIYQTNTYCKNCSANIVGISQKDGFDIVIPDKSPFFPEGGGQPADTGIIKSGNREFNITYVYDEEQEGAVFHVTDAPAGTFKEGDEVELTLDWDARFINMQRHCGEHMLSGAFHNLYSGINRGFHIGNGYIAIDIECDGRILTAAEVAAAENMVNAAIRANLPVDVTYFDSYEESKIRPVRKDVPHDGRVSVVTIGDLDAPYDCIACCGTHPATSSEVGLLAVYRFEPNKGNTRIIFDCGKPALDKLKADYNTAYAVSNSLSTSIDELPRKLELQAEHEAGLKAQLASLTAYYKEKEAEAMQASIDEKRVGGEHVYNFTDEVLNTNDLLKLGFSLAAKLRPGELLLMTDSNTATVLLYSDGSALKCGDIVKAEAASFNGRGGGRPDNARAAFADIADARAFAEHLANAY
ncbi:MAG: alanine--tRNA ligase-related protein [Firmicutes bacterium]|nr:alanine--tRNA ligase-related protein [Bacillota bacterium]